MTDIPQDIMDAAKKVREDGHGRPDWFLEEPHVLAIAKAILAEREHTAELLKDPAAVRINYLRGDIACQHLIDEAVEAERQRDQWQDISTAPKDGTIVNVVGRYPEATSGFPRYAGYHDGQWLEYSRFQPQPLICWAWRPRGDWPREGTPT